MIELHESGKNFKKSKELVMKTKSIAYIDLLPVLTKAIQRQQATIESQQKQIDDLVSEL